MIVNSAMVEVGVEPVGPGARRGPESDRTARLAALLCDESDGATPKPPRESAGLALGHDGGPFRSMTRIGRRLAAKSACDHNAWNTCA
jgi:hypothetical protein